ncbi:MAG: alpha/beta hydrolase [Myxococcales bacterium]|nr:alpha/beta hydrolase [Myxococcales bacterium]
MYIVPLVEKLARRRLNRLGLRSRYVHTRDARIHLYEAIDDSRAGPPIVILHGLGASATSFGRVLAGLRGSAPRLLAPDAPGHGFSQAHRRCASSEELYVNLAEALDRELDEPAIVVGNSLGGAFAIRYAARNPERIAGLVLASPAGAPVTDAELDDLLGAFRIRDLRGANALTERLYHQPPWFRALIAPDLRRHFQQPFFQALVGALSQADTLSIDEVRSLQAPTLLLWGKSERLLPGSGLDFFREHLPAHAVIEEPEDFGHCPNLDRPRALAQRIAAFSRELQGKG